MSTKVCTCRRSLVRRRAWSSQPPRDLSSLNLPPVSETNRQQLLHTQQTSPSTLYWHLLDIAASSSRFFWPSYPEFFPIMARSKKHGQCMLKVVWGLLYAFSHSLTNEDSYKRREIQIIPPETISGSPALAWRNINITWKSAVWGTARKPALAKAVDRTHLRHTVWATGRPTVWCCANEYPG